MQLQTLKITFFFYLMEDLSPSGTQLFKEYQRMFFIELFWLCNLDSRHLLLGDGCNAFPSDALQGSNCFLIMSFSEILHKLWQYSLMEVVLFPFSVCCLVLKCIFFGMWLHINFCKGTASQKVTRDWSSFSFLSWLYSFLSSQWHLSFCFVLFCLTRWRSFRELDESKPLWYEKSSTSYSQWERVWSGKKL